MSDQVSCSRCLQKGHNIWTCWVPRHSRRCCLPGRLHALVCKKWILPFMAIWYLFLLPPHTHSCLATTALVAVLMPLPVLGSNMARKGMSWHIFCVCVCVHACIVCLTFECMYMYVCMWVGGWVREIGSHSFWCSRNNYFKQIMSICL